MLGITFSGLKNRWIQIPSKVKILFFDWYIKLKAKNNFKLLINTLHKTKTCFILGKSVGWQNSCFFPDHSDGNPLRAKRYDPSYILLEWGNNDDVRLIIHSAQSCLSTFYVSFFYLNEVETDIFDFWVLSHSWAKSDHSRINQSLSMQTEFRNQLFLDHWSRKRFISFGYLEDWNQSRFSNQVKFAICFF